LKRLEALIDACPQTYKQRLEKIKTYMKNDTAQIVDYRKRQKTD
jgi:hypothetical protein